MTDHKRRNFLLKSMACGVTGVAFSSVRGLAGLGAIGSAQSIQGLGPLVPTLPLNASALTDTVLGDLSQTPLLALPPGFQYRAYSITGQTMDDGSLVPGKHDGMAAFGGQNGQTILIRNHELSPDSIQHGNPLGVVVPDADKYDTGATGGTTHLIFDQAGELQGHYASLGGTIRNCSGGQTPWNSWITCEETVFLPGKVVNQKHGYAFEVPADITAPVPAEPLLAMGRFRREAVAVDEVTGYVYQTEDREDGALYRFRPDVPGGLSSGVLEALVVQGQPNFDSRTQVIGQLGQPYALDWVALTDVDPAADTLRVEAQNNGAALFARAEGIGYGDGMIYFSCTTGGDLALGQIWVLDPINDTLTLFVESVDEAVMSAPDNLVFGPDQVLYVCEDRSGIDHVVGIRPDGSIFKLVENVLNSSEFAGVCFSPDQQYMFVNSQGLGVTFVIWGPWIDFIYKDGFDHFVE